MVQLEGNDSGKDDGDWWCWRIHEGSTLPTLLSSMTVLRDSIHMGSMSPSKTIHLGPSPVMLARSRMTTENRPGTDTMKVNKRSVHLNSARAMKFSVK